MPIQRYKSLYCKTLGKQWTDETDLVILGMSRQVPKPIVEQILVRKFQ